MRALHEINYLSRRLDLMGNTLDELGKTTRGQGRRAALVSDVKCPLVRPLADKPTKAYRSDIGYLAPCTTGALLRRTQKHDVDIR